MPRKTFIDFAAVRDALSFSVVLSHYELPCPDGKDQFKIRCPFHEDSTPSCSIHTSGKFNCFGCSAKGNELDFIILMEGGSPENHEDRYKAAELAITIIGGDPANFGRQANDGSSSVKAKPAKGEASAKEAKPEKPTKNTPKPSKNAVFDRVLQLDCEHEFLAGRGITAELAEKFGLGFCPKGIMKDRIAIPIHNAAGELVGYVGRYAAEELPEDTDRYRFPKLFQKSLELWNIHRALTLEKRFLILVEGYWSAIRMHEMGIPTVAIMGTSVSPEQAQLIRTAGVKYTIQMLDGDDAGRKAAKENAHILSQHVYVRTIELPEGEKPDSVPAKFLEAFA